MAVASCSSAEPVSVPSAAPREVARSGVPQTTTPGDAASQDTAETGPRSPQTQAYTIVATARAAELVARAAPEPGAEVVASFPNPNPNGIPPVFQVVGPIDGPWLEVRLPIRPNGSTGWIPAHDVDLSRNSYRIEIATEDHRLVVYRDDALVVETEVAIGTGDTPTPLGSFYLTELLQPPDPDGPYGTYAFGLSGFSETLQSFNGGEGVIGIHGTNDPAALGTDVSHGCIRVANETIEEMASFLPLGTSVLIKRRTSEF